jgi:hypothetical protein
MESDVAGSEKEVAAVCVMVGGTDEVRDGAIGFEGTICRGIKGEGEEEEVEVEVEAAAEEEEDVGVGGDERKGEGFDELGCEGATCKVRSEEETVTPPRIRGRLLLFM